MSSLVALQWLPQWDCGMGPIPDPRDFHMLWVWTQEKIMLSINKFRNFRYTAAII